MSCKDAEGEMKVNYNQQGQRKEKKNVSILSCREGQRANFILFYLFLIQFNLADLCYFFETFLY
jgi:hypothetical protein